MKSPKLIAKLRQRHLKRLRERMRYKEKVLEIKGGFRRNSNSLLWVWEFSKKAVLICFLFYVATQIYAMAVMWHTLDFSSLPNLIDRTAELTERCVFMYLVKASLENVGKIWFHRKTQSTDDVPEG